MKNSLPVLIDFDGVVKIGNSPADDTREFLQFISYRKYPAIILSNSTILTGNNVKEFLSDYDMNFGIECITTVDASLQYLKKYNLKVSVYCNDAVKLIFKGFINDENPDAVLIGDLGENWSYKTMNDIFNRVYAGAGIIAMHKNKYWKPADKLCLDAGAFISAIEYAAGKESVVIGKPSPLYFQLALNKLGADKQSSFVMIGDDIENDIFAAQKNNGRGILVYTGKTKFPLPLDSKIKPDFEARNLTEVISFFQENLSGPQPPDHQDQITHLKN